MEKANSKTKLKDSPGPGSYQYKGFTDKEIKPTVLFGGAERFNKTPEKEKNMDNQFQSSRYFDRMGKEGPFVTLKGKRPDQVSNSLPGPGNYNIKEKSNCPSFSLSKDKRRDLSLKNDNPGPGAYRDDYNPKRPLTAVKYSNSVSPKQEDEFRRTLPGPGQYKIENTIGKSPGAILIGRPKVNKIEEKARAQVPLRNPDDSAIRKKNPSALIYGRSPHMLEFTSNRFVPGPGKYNPSDNKKTNTVVFGQPPDPNFEKKNRERHLTPGPGAYKTMTNFGTNAKSVTILSRNEEGPKQRELRHFSPGPGAYNIDRFNKTHGPSFSIKGAVSEDPIFREKAAVPASGTYYPRDDFVKKGIPSISFGSRPPKPPKGGIKSDGPGPGSYKIPSTLNTRKGAVISGTYNERGRNSRGFSAGRNSRGFSAGGNAASRSKSSKFKRNNSLPGPGSYNPDSNGFGKTKKNVIIMSRPKEKPPNYDTPGPGSYQDPKGIGAEGNTKGVILLGRYKEDLSKQNDSPGPGAYDIKRNKFNNGIASATFGHGKRFKYSFTGDPNHKGNNSKNPGEDTPGPGAYKVKEEHPGPKFSITGVKENQELFQGRHQSPGPGSYNNNDNLDVRIQGGRFSSSERPSDKPNDAPGPGEYRQHLGNLPAGPAYSLKSRYPEKADDSLPGPGHYDPPISKIKERKFYLFRKKKLRK
ncbi:unnamed protein product [Moneuplotes crassus]|uniref:Uncharacterized protein n=2 Tax=Euplotes crassus TaxID=5936 RepID=A0AAD1U0V1_EUPCR|nr:unnamed protein product [Moneuplotes crassus]